MAAEPMQLDDRPLPSSVEGIIEEMYQGEAGGEAFFCALLSRFTEPDQQYKLGSLLQLETEFKARLRPIAFAHGINLAESDDVRQDIAGMLDTLQADTWVEFVKSFAGLMPMFVRRFEQACAALPEEHAELGRIAMEHETSIAEFADLESAGETGRSIDRVVKQLIYPLRRPD